MSEPDSTTGADTAAPEATTPPAHADPDTAPATDTAEDSPGREAARYRRQLRETEAEHDALREQLAAHQRQAAERLVAGRLADPRDLWVAGIELPALLDQDGAIDASKVDAAVDAVLASHPHWRAPSPKFNGGPRRTAEAASGGWADLLRGGR